MMKIKHEHESFCNISFSRIHGNSIGYYYGASVQRQDSCIELTVKESFTEIDGYGNQAPYSHGLPLIRVRMTNTQFADLITSFNMSGVSATLVTFNRKNVVQHEPIQDMSRLSVAKERIQATIEKIHEDVDRKVQSIKELLNKPSLGKRDRDIILREVQNIVGTVNDRVPFALECIQEAINDMSSEAVVNLNEKIAQKLQATFTQSEKLLGPHK